MDRNRASRSHCRWAAPATGVALGVLLVVAGAGAVSSGAASNSGSPPTLPATASGLQAKAISDAESSSWVHEVGRGTGDGHTFSSANDIGTFEGRQMIHSDKARAEVIQIGQAAYIEGNAAAVSSFFGLTKDDPQQLADTWISIAPSDGGEFTTVSDAVTLKSDFQDVTIPGAVTEGYPVTVDGQRCIPIIGHTSQPSVGTVTSTLYVTDSASPLPVEIKSVAKGGLSTTTWSRWGKAVNLTAPPDAVPFSSLFSSSAPT